MADFFKIATWNVNSIRVREKQVVDWLQRNNIDIVLLQELKCQLDHFPKDEFESLGYNCYVRGQKTYNGVAILSKYPADEVIYNFPNNPCEDEARFIEISLDLPIGYSRVSSVYVPNGGEVGSDKFQKKLIFLKELGSYLDSIDFDEKLIIGGDFNVAPEENDVYSEKEMQDQTCFTLEERNLIRKIKNKGLVDPADLFTKDFTWWDYRAGCFQNNKGLRIDYFLMDPNLCSVARGVSVDKLARSQEKASDHAPVCLTFGV